MSIKYIFPFLIVLLIMGCIEDPEEVGVLYIYNQTNSTVISRIAVEDSTVISIDTIPINNRIFRPGIVDNFVDNTVSVELIRLSDNKSLVYYRSDINNDNYQSTKNRTIFNEDNWEKISGDLHEYYIKEEHFD